MSGRSIALVASLALLGAIIGAGCAAPLDDPARFAELGQGGGPGTCGDITQTVFVKTCASAGCHSAASKAQGLDLESANVAYRLVNVCSTEGPGRLVDTASPSNSILFAKLSPTPPFGSRMPLGKAPLDDATMQCVLAWISNQSGPAQSGSCGESSGDDAGASGTDAAGE